MFSGHAFHLTLVIWRRCAIQHFLLLAGRVPGFLHLRVLLGSIFHWPGLPVEKRSKKYTMRITTRLTRDTAFGGILLRACQHQHQPFQSHRRQMCTQGQCLDAVITGVCSKSLVMLRQTCCQTATRPNVCCEHQQTDGLSVLESLSDCFTVSARATLQAVPQHRRGIIGCGFATGTIVWVGANITVIPPE